jgi:hypothetical protein
MTVYRGFRIAVTIALVALVAILIGGLLLDIAVDSGQFGDSLDQLDESNPLFALDSMSVFWPTFLFLCGLALGLWFEGALRRLTPRKRPPTLTFVFDPNDFRCLARDFPDGQSAPVRRFHIGVHNASGTHVIENIVVSAVNNAFVRQILAPGLTNRQIGSLAPNVTEFIEVLGIPESADALKLAATPRRFVVRAKAKDTKRISATFEFNARANPMLRRVR